MRRVESESAERDKQLAEAITKIGQYESGTYGLHEAVQVGLNRSGFSFLTLGAELVTVDVNQILFLNNKHVLGNQGSKEAARDQR